MKSGFKFLEVMFSVNKSNERKLLTKLYSALDNVSEATFVTAYDNGGKFLINTSRSNEVIAAIGERGFAVLQIGIMEDSKSLFAIIAPGAAGSFQELDEKRISKLWN